MSTGTPGTPASGSTPGTPASSGSTPGTPASGSTPGTPASSKEGSLDGVVLLAGRVLAYGGIAAVIVFLVRPDMPLATKLLHVLLGLAVGAALVRVIAGHRYFGWFVVGGWFAFLAVLALTMENPPLPIHLLSYLLGLRLGPVDVAKRDERRARNEQAA